MNFKKDLKDNEKGIEIVRYVFLPILVFSVIAGYFKDNSKDYIEKKYKEANDYSFFGVVYEKKIEGGDGYRFPHYLFLNSGIRWQINAELFEEIEIGDSVSKISKSDSVYYYKKNGKVIIKDENSYLREKYFAKLKKK